MLFQKVDQNSSSSVVFLWTMSEPKCSALQQPKSLREADFKEKKKVFKGYFLYSLPSKWEDLHLLYLPLKRFKWLPRTGFIAELRLHIIINPNLCLWTFSFSFFFGLVFFALCGKSCGFEAVLWTRESAQEEQSLRRAKSLSWHTRRCWLRANISSEGWPESQEQTCRGNHLRGHKWSGGRLGTLTGHHGEMATQQWWGQDHTNPSEATDDFSKTLRINLQS